MDSNELLWIVFMYFEVGSPHLLIGTYKYAVDLTCLVST